MSHHGSPGKVRGTRGVLMLAFLDVLMAAVRKPAPVSC